ncbi:hydantoinase B/oxoprolinase family protein [Aminobacter niigataensis]|uniref:hydantoinase B/oxoprolinase family protein n=1 Tax=Aminobacter niigataensis TaxID=83265 RepID=UPI0024C961A7|nr:hydantoinase B/oxoprolinase family protein [Aminobacter niigataensis]CAI2931836.1 putative hydantoinase/oxoprolinase subunit B [Aminobacter niigataensis]
MHGNQKTRRPTRIEPSISPIDLDIFRGRLNAISDEMAIVLARTSMSPVIYEVLDFSCGICAPDGNLVSQANGITAFTGIYANIIKAIRKKYGHNIRPGDVFITNDPFVGHTHTADVAVINPVFFQGALVAFAISIAHWAELGGTVPGTLSPTATEIYHEGLRFNSLKLFREGHREENIFDLIESNVRLPSMTLGDLYAEIASVRIGALRLRELCERYGSQKLILACDEILKLGEKAGRRGVMALPDGTYTAHDWIDGDGVSDESIPVCVSVTIEKDTMTVDFSGSAPERRSPLNCTKGALEAAVRTVFKAIVDPGRFSNDGCFRPLKVLVPAASIFSARPPSPTGWYYEATAHAIDLVWKALAPILSDRLGVGSYLSLCVSYIGGVDPGTNSTFVVVEPHVGGWGARKGTDGEHAMIAVTDGETCNYSIELFESKYPVRINEYSLNVAEAAGAGCYRGGLGTVREYEMMADDCFMFASIGRSVHKPWGYKGGDDGSANFVELIRDGSLERAARVPYTPLRKGDRFRVLTGSGGGYGSPLERDHASIKDDLKQGYVDRKTARQVYGYVGHETRHVPQDTPVVVER